MLYCNGKFIDLIQIKFIFRLKYFGKNFRPKSKSCPNLQKLPIKNIYVSLFRVMQINAQDFFLSEITIITCIKLKIKKQVLKPEIFKAY